MRAFLSATLAVLFLIQPMVDVLPFFLWSLAWGATAQQPLPPEAVAPLEIPGVAPWRLEADKITARRDSDIVEASGHVILSRGKDSLSADFARFFRSTNWIYLKGNVDALWRGDRLTAKEAEFSLKDRVGWLKDGQLFMAGPHLYVKGALIRRTSGDTYAFKNAKITACDDPKPAWSLSAQDGDITLDGYARLRNVGFQVKDKPVLYSPVLMIPAKTTRQSGLLKPQAGLSSLKGATFNQPYYWVVDEDSDATFYENFMSKRGMMQGLEYRHVGEKGTKGLWRLDWLHDQKVAASEGDAPTPLDKDGLVRANRERWWARGMYNSRLADTDWKFKMDLDMVSDQDYLREFGSGYSGFEKSRAELLKEFSRNIADADQNRTTTLLLTRSWEKFGMATKLGWTQATGYGHGNSPLSQDPSLQRLPQVAGYVYKDRLGGSPLEWEAEAEAVNFVRRNGPEAKRLDMAPHVSLPLTAKYGSVQTTVGMRQTLYSVDADDDPSLSTRTTRNMPDFSMTAFTELFRVYGLKGDKLKPTAENEGQSQWTSIKHSVQPRISLDMRSSAGGSRRPQFDHLDSLEPVSELRYSISNILSRKRDVVLAPESPEGEKTPSLQTDYLDFLRFRLEQSYDYREASRKEELARYEKRPFSDILGEVSLITGPRVSLINKTWYSPYLTRITEHEHTLRYELSKLATVSFGLDYQAAVDEYKRKERGDIDMYTLGLDLNLGKSWTASLAYRVDQARARDLEKSLMLMYNHQCYGVGFSYSRVPLEDRVEVLFEFTGLSF